MAKKAAVPRTQKQHILELGIIKRALMDIISSYDVSPSEKLHAIDMLMSINKEIAIKATGEPNNE